MLELRSLDDDTDVGLLANPLEGVRDCLDVAVFYCVEVVAVGNDLAADRVYGTNGVNLGAGSF
jgi:hypothetical protein